MTPRICLPPLRWGQRPRKRRRRAARAAASGIRRGHGDRAEPLGLDAEGGVELATEVLYGDGGRELHDLRLGEVLADAIEQFVRHVGGVPRDLFGVLQRPLLAGGEG